MKKQNIRILFWLIQENGYLSIGKQTYYTLNLELNIKISFCLSFFNVTTYRMHIYRYVYILDSGLRSKFRAFVILFTPILVFQ